MHQRPPCKEASAGRLGMACRTNNPGLLQKTARKEQKGRLDRKTPKTSQPITNYRADLDPDSNNYTINDCLRRQSEMGIVTF